MSQLPGVFVHPLKLLQRGCGASLIGTTRAAMLSTGEWRDLCRRRRDRQFHAERTAPPAD